MANDQYQVPKIRARVVVHPPGRECEIFLSPSARGHSGHETVANVLDAPEPFLATHDDDGVALVRKSEINWVKVLDPLEVEDAFLDNDWAGVDHPVGITFSDGSRLEGSLIEIAPDASQRVSDIVNSEGAVFLHFQNDDSYYLVHLQRVSRIRVSRNEEDEHAGSR